MNEIADVPAFAMVATAIFLVTGAAITLVGALGLLRLPTFYERVHAPTLGTTLGTGLIVIASMIYFTATGARPILHELLILLFVTMTTPITLMILVRAALSREMAERNEPSAEELRN
jgi:multicomponent K+:H+ antiporter subunit G